AFFLVVVNSLVAATLAALVADALGAGAAVVAVVGVAGGVAYAGGSLVVGNRVFAGAMDDVRFPTPPDDGASPG
ncbi:MAG TPA: hypothetical protein VF140_03075, partial [Phycicoccus sp.]